MLRLAKPAHPGQFMGVSTTVVRGVAGTGGRAGFCEGRVPTGWMSLGRGPENPSL